MAASYPIPPYLDGLGIPFVRGGRGPDAYDCYGWAIELFRRVGVTVPDFTSPGTAEEIEDLISDASRAWRPVPIGTLGALHTFRVEGIGSHVGILVEGDRYTHCIEGAGVTTDRLSNPLLRPIAAYVYE